MAVARSVTGSANMRVMPLAYHEISFADTSSTEGKNFLEFRHLAYHFNSTCRQRSARCSALIIPSRPCRRRLHRKVAPTLEDIRTISLAKSPSSKGIADWRSFRDRTNETL